MIEIDVFGMHCMFCAYRLRAAVRKFDPCLYPAIDWRRNRVRVERPEDAETVRRALAYLADRG